MYRNYKYASKPPIYSIRNLCVNSVQIMLNLCSHVFMVIGLPKRCVVITGNQYWTHSSRLKSLRNLFILFYFCHKSSLQATISSKFVNVSVQFMFTIVFVIIFVVLPITSLFLWQQLHFLHIYYLWNEIWISKIFS